MISGEMDAQVRLMLRLVPLRLRSNFEKIFWP